MEENEIFNEQLFHSEERRYLNVKDFLCDRIRQGDFGCMEASEPNQMRDGFRILIDEKVEEIRCGILIIAGGYVNRNVCTQDFTRWNRQGEHKVKLG